MSDAKHRLEPTLIHGVRAKSHGERIAHAMCRQAFLSHVIADERTYGHLFAWWGEHYGLDALIDDVAAFLEDVGAGAGLLHRS